MHLQTRSSRVQALRRIDDPSYAGHVDPLRHKINAAGIDPAIAQQAQASLPKTNEQAKQFAQMLLAQMETSMGSLTSEDGSDDGGGESGIDSSSMSGLAALGGMGAASALQGADPKSLAALMPLLTGAGGAGAGAASGGGMDIAALLSGAQASSGTAQLNAPVTGHGTHGAAANAQVVAAAAARHGADPTLAVAMMLVESGGNEHAVGDGGTSFGLFQLHQGGMLTAAGLSPAQAFDPATNANVAMRSLAATARSRPHADPGTIAAASQRPADQAGYAVKVNAAMAEARRLLGQAH